MSFLRKPFYYRYENAVMYIICLTIGVYLLQRIAPQVNLYLAMNPILVIHGWVWQLGTYMFAHGGISHLVFNMLALFIFGTQVERRMGTWEFILFYLLTGILAGAFSFAVYYLTGSYQVFLMGASGAIFAVQLAFATYFPNQIIYVWGILPLRAPMMVLGFTGLSLVSSFAQNRSNVAHLTHLAGFAFGWLYFLVRFGTNPWKAFRR